MAEVNYNAPPCIIITKCNNSYFMPVCSWSKTITLRCCGQPDALLHEAEGQGIKCIRSPQDRGVIVRLKYKHAQNYSLSPNPFDNVNPLKFFAAVVKVM